MKKKFQLIFVLLFVTLQLQATNYYVDANSGNNANNGLSVTAAKKDFSFCNGIPTALSPGDTVFIMNGTYVATDNSPILRLAFIGTATKPIVFTNYPGHQPVFKYSGLPHALIAFNWAMKTAFVVVNGIKLEGNNLANPFESTLARAKNQTNNCLNNTVGQPTQAEFNVDGFGIYDNGTGCAHITISNCEISNFPGGGIATGGLDYLTIENCKIYNNGWFAIDGNSGISVLKCKNYDNHPSGDFAIKIRNNIVYNNINYIPWNGICRFSDGNGIIVDLLVENGYDGKVLVENNVCYDNGGAGIQYFKSNNGVVRNNTLYRNGKQDGLPGFQGYRSGEFSMYNSTNVKFYNNIVFPIPGKVAVTSGPADATKICENNLIVSNISGGFIFDATKNILNQDPQFMNAAANDFRIRCTSPTVNAGTNAAGLFSPSDITGTRRPIGNRPDIGAYEANCTPNQCSATISSPSNSFCAGENIVLTASAGASYRWLRGATQVGTARNYTATIAGSYTVEVTNASGCKATSTPVVITTTICEVKAPYTGTAITLPGIIEAENYDKGGQGVSYNDLDITNNGNQYRNNSVDIATANGGYVIGWTDVGEWLEFTINVIRAGDYDFEFIAASLNGGGEISLSLGNSIIASSIAVPSTNSWNIYKPFTETISLSRTGRQVLRVNILRGGFNLDKIVVKPLTVINNTKVVQIRKRNASTFAIDGNFNGADGQNVYLWSSNSSNVNQQWIEIDRGNGYFSYQKVGTNHCIDGNNGGANNQNVFLWTCNDSNQNQQWKKIDMGSGYFRLEKRNAPGFSLDGGFGGADGQNLKVYSSNNSNQNQHWSFTTVNLQSSSSRITENTFSIYPNPVIDVFTFDLSENVIGKKANGKIYDNSGVMVQSFTIASSNPTISVKDLKSGLYLIYVEGKYNTYTTKMIKQ